MWFFIGLALFVWAIYDLIVGEVWLHRAIHRSSEPALYWVVVLLWLGIAVATMYYTAWWW